MLANLLEKINMSLIGKTWVIQNKSKDLNVLEKLLINRGIQNSNERQLFFESDMQNLHDPFIMKDMQKAINRIQNAISANEKALVPL